MKRVGDVMVDRRIVGTERLPKWAVVRYESFINNNDPEREDFIRAIREINDKWFHYYNLAVDRQDASFSQMFTDCDHLIVEYVKERKRLNEERLANIERDARVAKIQAMPRLRHRQRSDKPRARLSMIGMAMRACLSYDGRYNWM